MLLLLLLLLLHVVVALMFAPRCMQTQRRNWRIQWHNEVAPLSTPSYGKAVVLSWFASWMSCESAPALAPNQPWNWFGGKGVLERKLRARPSRPICRPYKCASGRMVKKNPINTLLNLGRLAQKSWSCYSCQGWADVTFDRLIKIGMSLKFTCV